MGKQLTLIADLADPIPCDEDHLMIPVHPCAHIENSSCFYSNHNILVR
jgi:phosphoribosyl-AMP cyclohydrolase